MLPFPACPVLNDAEAEAFAVRVAAERRLNTWQHVMSLSDEAQRARALEWQFFLATEPTCVQMTQIGEECKPTAPATSKPQKARSTTGRFAKRGAPSATVVLGKEPRLQPVGRLAAVIAATACSRQLEDMRRGIGAPAPAAAAPPPAPPAPPPPAIRIGHRGRVCRLPKRYDDDATPAAPLPPPRAPPSKTQGGRRPGRPRLHPISADAAPAASRAKRGSESGDEAAAAPPRRRVSSSSCDTRDLSACREPLERGRGGRCLDDERASPPPGASVRGKRRREMRLLDFAGKRDAASLQEGAELLMALGSGSL